jgi:hypothetical protein
MVKADKKRIQPPPGTILKEYHEFFILIGPDLDLEKYQAFRKTLPRDVRIRLMGWRRSPGLRLAGQH